MSAPYGDPAYKPLTWKTGYQSRQVGVSGPSVLQAMSNAPAAMTTASTQPLDNPGTYVTTPAPVVGTGGAEVLPK